ncbi:PAS domain-containing sensor histidine kinase [Corallococcus sp. AB045]|uniref:PAS domain-containing sensor histidine kinase n=1 Tax=Corallococcus sp. AB045 TaxID=2316719 RepID=UPI000ED6530F|nr:PAS domain S-box protein [Corallococcus sp. AB045]RKH85466.1 PAS domain-containing sensor histidine kinase [Corallococcus sp. AB045]
MPQPVFQRLPGALPSLGVPEETLPFLSALLNAPGWGVALVDGDSRLVWMNDLLASLCGRPAQLCVGRFLSEAWPGLSPPLSPLLARAQSGERVAEELVWGRFGEVGTLRHLTVSAMPAAPASGVLLLLRDSSARLREEAALRASEEHMRSIVEISCDGYFFHDRGQFLDISPGLGRLMGYYETAELIGRNILEVVAPEFRAPARDVMDRGVEAPYELAVLHRDGRRIPVEVMGRPATFQGRSVRMGAVWDVSIRKAAEERLMRMEHFRDQFLDAAGDGFKAPLQSLHCEVLALQHAPSLPEGLTDQVGRVGQGVRRVERLIRQLLDFTRARLSNGLPIQPSSIHLGQLAERVLADRQRAHPGRDLRLVTNGDLRGAWDGERLFQLMDSLVGNALHHGPMSSSVVLQLTGRFDGVTVQVHDPDCRVPPEYQGTLFEPFKHRALCSADDGLGLSLFIVRQIALAHGGRISVESGAADGTRFIVWLPREDGPSVSGA